MRATIAVPTTPSAVIRWAAPALLEAKDDGCRVQNCYGLERSRGRISVYLGGAVLRYRLGVKLANSDEVYDGNASFVRADGRPDAVHWVPGYGSLFDGLRGLGFGDLCPLFRFCGMDGSIGLAWNEQKTIHNWGAGNEPLEREGVEKIVSQLLSLADRLESAGY